VDFRILGELEVDGDDGRPLLLGGHKPRAFLALLVLHRTEVVSVDTLIDNLWGARAPASAANMLQIYASRLRKQLPQEMLITKPPGYLLRLEPDEVDAERFERLAGEGRRALKAGSPQRAARILSDALSLFRGPPLLDFTFELFAQAEVARLAEMKTAALEDRIEAELALGHDNDLVARLEALISDHPLRERLHRQLMLALYRSGRQAEALERYRNLRLRLVEELGLEPSRELQELERAILRHDSSLEAPLPKLATQAAQAPISPPAREVRKTVSVLSFELAGAGRTPDPELVARVAAGARETVDRVLARHHGILHGRSGARMSAVFGTPRAHEDDALRACRAALELRSVLAEGEGQASAPIEFRAGIEAGTVFAAETPEAPSAITGCVIDTAAELAQAAQPDEILVGEGAEALLRFSARLERAQLANARHRLDGRPAWELVELTSDSPIPRRLDAPLVGRETELKTLVEMFEETARTHRAFIVSLLGPPGIGKSRLAAELRSAVAGRARILFGRCLPYGEGITFWPLKEVLDELLGERAGQTLATLLAGEDDVELVSERVAGLVGATESAAAGSEEIVWAVRRLVETLARARPLVLVFDDCQWAEPAFLDLVESLVKAARGTALLVVALARPELLEERPNWARACSLLLEPLSDQDCKALMRDLGGGKLPADELCEQIAAAAEGNPLFVEQMLAMAQAEEDGALRVPPTIQALLAARLDRLPDSERELIGAASVVGKEFWRGALSELTTERERAEVDSRLRSLVQKNLIYPARSRFFDGAFRFRHILIRDAAYEALPKARRAELHERFAGWLEGVAPERVREFEEILGYHLEQAWSYQTELAMPSEHAAELALRAGTRLASAGRRALGRGDAPGAVNLLTRAGSLLPERSPERLASLIGLYEALADAGAFERASVLDEAVRLSKASGERSLEWQARLLQMRRRWHTKSGATLEEAHALGVQAVRVFSELGDEAGLARAWHAVAQSAFARYRATEALDALRSAAAHANKASEPRMFARIMHLYLGLLAYGPTPVQDAAKRCEDVLARRRLAPRVRASAFRVLAILRAMQGDFEEARRLVERDRALLEELGLRMGLALAADCYGWIELLAGEPAHAAREFRAGLQMTEDMGDSATGSSLLAMLALAEYENGRLGEALRASKLSQELAPFDDAHSQMLWRGPQAKVLARRGRTKDAEALAREAVALAAETDFLMFHADALMDLAEVLRLLGQSAEARPLIEEAVRLYIRKGNVVSAARAKVQLHSSTTGLRATASSFSSPNDFGRREQLRVEHVPRLDTGPGSPGPV
jgi:DNA-binding SARP family transcriptional activator